MGWARLGPSGGGSSGWWRDAQGERDVVRCSAGRAGRSCQRACPSAYHLLQAAGQLLHLRHGGQRRYVSGLVSGR